MLGFLGSAADQADRKHRDTLGGTRPGDGMKPSPVVDEKFLTKCERWERRNVKWLRDGNVSVKFLFALEVIALILVPIFGWSALISLKNEYEKLSSEDAFQKDIASRGVRPPGTNLIMMKTSNRAFNHTHDFAIENDVIWTRSNKSSSEWKPIYFPGFPDRKPVSLSVDGNNLIVLDQHNCVHYKKVLIEFRQKELQDDPKLGFMIKEDSLKQVIDSGPYIAIDQTTENNWVDAWFTLPIVSIFYNAIFGKELRLIGEHEPLAVAMSHRGRYNNHIEDAAGQTHEVSEGVTTLYVLDKSGTNIFKFDPWSPTRAKMNLSTPETVGETFRAVNMAASASTIMLIGYKKDKATNRQSMSIQTCLADIDTQGWNPGISYDYYRHEDDSTVRVIPSKEWIEHPLMLKEGAFVTNEITIIQTGEGNKARELRVRGTDEMGLPGFYYKKLHDKDWRFEFWFSNNEAVPLPPEEASCNLQFKETVNDFQEIQSPNETRKPYTLSSFGANSSQSVLLGTIDEKRFVVCIHRTKTLWNFLGFEGDSFNLFVPEGDHHKHLGAKNDGNQMFRQKVLKNRKVVPVKVIQNGNELSISAWSVFGPKFNFKFKKRCLTRDC